MADKAISELVAAEQIKSTDMFVLEQDGTAKRLQGQTLLNWLTAAADGHGGISNIAKTGTDGLVDTYTITLADTTTKTFTVTNGNGLTAFEKLSTVGLVDTYRFTRSDGTYFTFAVANGAKGDTGEASHVWIKYASQQPTASSHSMGDLPDAWMGVYSGAAAEAPDDWQQYTWYQIKGEKGDTGAAATVTGTTAEYMVSDSGTIVPSGSWSTTIPTVPQGKYLWTRVTTTFNTGSPAVSYSVTRMGIDGTGSVSSVNEKSPDESGNVSLTAADIATSGGESVEAKLNTLDEEKQPLLTPGDNISISGSVIATKAFPCNPNMLDNWYFGKPVNQRGQTSYTGGGYGVDRWKTGEGVAAALANGALNISYSTPGWNLVEPLDNMLVPGVTYTLSCIYKASVNPIRLVVAWGDSSFFYNEASPISDDWALAQITGTIPANATISFNQVVIQSLGSSAGDFSLKAVKLELGSQQTLAHQENGVWVLNEVPDYGEQLLRCQRYYQIIEQYSAYAGAADSNGNLLVPIYPSPSMRVRPSIAFEGASGASLGTAYFTDGTKADVKRSPATGGNGAFLNLNFTNIGKTNLGAIFRTTVKATLSADL
jgi:hypothetical protein